MGRSAKPRGSHQHDVVLLSGGIDSSAALALALEGRREVTGLFIDYGQASATRERHASVAVARHFGVPCEAMTVTPCRFGSGEIRGRNAFLVALAVMASGRRHGNVIIGIHSGSAYPDCTPDFVEIEQQLLALETAGTVGLASPFINLAKNEIVELARRLNVPIELTYSCEAGNEPCGRCLSCLDRASALASA